MTSICTALGLVPMALGIGEGAELQAPLARVVIGGLLTSTMITLVFVPAMYTLFEEGWSGLFKKGAAATAKQRTDGLPGHRVDPVTGHLRERLEHEEPLAESSDAAPPVPARPPPDPHTGSGRDRASAPRRRCGRCRPRSRSIASSAASSSRGRKRRLADHHAVQEARLDVGDADRSGVDARWRCGVGWISRRRLADREGEVGLRDRRGCCRGRWRRARVRRPRRPPLFHPAGARDDAACAR